MPPETTDSGSAPAVATVAAPPAVAQTVTIPLKQLQTFTSIQARLAQVEAEQRTRDDAARVEQVKLLAQKGEIENALRISANRPSSSSTPSGRSEARSRNGPSDMPSMASCPAFWPRSPWCLAARAAHPALEGPIHRGSAGG